MPTEGPAEPVAVVAGPAVEPSETLPLGDGVAGTAEWGAAREEPAGVGDTPLGEDGPHALSARAKAEPSRATPRRGRVLMPRR